MEPYNYSNNLNLKTVEQKVEPKNNETKPETKTDRIVKEKLAIKKEGFKKEPEQNIAERLAQLNLTPKIEFNKFNFEHFSNINLGVLNQLHFPQVHFPKVHFPQAPSRQTSNLKIDYETKVKQNDEAFLIKNANKKDEEGMLPLHHAAKLGKLELVKTLYEKTKNINAKDKGNFTPLFLATQENHHDIIKFLLENGASGRIVNCEKQSPLHAACENGDGISVGLLLGDSDIDAIDENGMTALNFAVSSNRKNEQKFLFIVQDLLNKDAKATISDTDGFSPVHYAANLGSVEMLRILLTKPEHKILINQTTTEHFTKDYSSIETFTPLDLAKLEVNSNPSFANVIEFLRENGALEFKQLKKS